MNMVPTSVPINYSNTSTFYADNTGELGSFFKTPMGKTLLSIDYSGILSTGQKLSNLSFKLSPGTAPPLVISGAQVQGNYDIGSFLVSGGVGGLTYKLQIIAGLSDMQTVFVHNLEIAVSGTTQSDDCGCESLAYWGGGFGGRPPFSPFYQGRVPSVFQQANVLNGSDTKFSTTFITFFVDDKFPRSANIMDQWFNLDDGFTYQRVTNGDQVFWQRLTSANVSTAAIAPETPGLMDMWLDPATGSLNIWVGSGWFTVPTATPTDPDTAGNAVLYFQDAVPSNPVNAELWITTAGIASIWNATTNVWTQFGGGGGGSGGGIGYLPLSGGTLTGPLMAAADPTVSAGMATKNYVDTATIDAQSYDSSATQVNVVSIWDQNASIWDQGQSVWTT
jgi:hypothetical protein